MNVDRPAVGGVATCALLGRRWGWGELETEAGKWAAPATKCALYPPCAATRVIQDLFLAFSGKNVRRQAERLSDLSRGRML